MCSPAERESGGGLRLTVETDQQVEGCHRCGVLAVPHGRREHLLHDAPFGEVVPVFVELEVAVPRLMPASR